MTDKNPYRTLHARMSPPGAAWDEGFAAGRAAATPDPPDGPIPGPDPGACPRCGEWRKAGMIHRCPAASSDTPPEIERLRTAAHRRPDELIPVEEAEDAVWDVITRMNEEPAPCSGPAKRQARWLWEQSERPRVWADANGDHPILVPFPMAEQAVHVARASVVHEIVADLRAESEITGVARLAADRLADYIEQRYGATDPDVTQEHRGGVWKQRTRPARHPR